MQVKHVDEFSAVCEAEGVVREVSLFLLQAQQIAVGDYVVVHLGHAIQRVSEAEAAQAWRLYREMLGSAGA